ncbi:plasmatocyte-spreading peptide-like [Battus philenor]|uniref:plasmatocyte-spreading peptide-like n=1 Tax=Battus philenor TaxID=42288 RepID=UPI0035D02AB4
MKLSLFVFLCVGVTLLSNSVNGDVVVDLFGRIQQSAQKIGDDIKNVFQNNGRRRSQYKYEPVKVSKPEESEEDRIVFERPVTSTQATLTTTKATAKTNGTEQEGRENFRGACATGYERTADGRCKPTF